MMLLYTRYYNAGERPTTEILLPKPHLIHPEKKQFNWRFDEDQKSEIWLAPCRCHPFADKSTQLQWAILIGLHNLRLGPQPSHGNARENKENDS
jgi:hypothetical protein